MTLARPAALLIALVVLTGCASTAAEPEEFQIAAPAAACGDPQPLSIVVSPHANAPGLSLDAQMHCLLRGAVEAGEPVAIVKVDGKPDLLINEILPVDDANDTVRQDSIDAAVYGTVASVLESARPDEDGADLIAAVDQAAEALRSHGATNGRLLVTTPGLPDTGLLDMTLPGMLAADAAEIAAFTEKQSHLDLAPFHLILRGVGTTTAPQEPLAPVDRDAAVAALSALFELAGASVEVVPLPSKVTSVATEHTVATAAVPERAAPDLEQSEEPIVFDQFRIEFAPDSTTLVRPAEAAKMIAPVCDWLGADVTRTATFTGTTASAGTPEGRRKLSAQRAQVAADLCEDMAPARIQIVGAGTDHPGHVNDLDKGGNLIPHLAAKNRTVRVALHG